MLRSRIIIVAILLSAIYLAADAFLPNPDLILTLRVLDVTGLCIALWHWGADFMEAMESPKIRHGDITVAGVWLFLFACLMESVYVVVWRLAGRPSWLANSEITGVLILCQGSALSLLVMEPDSIAGRIPRANRIASGVGIGIAVAVVLLLFATRPDLGPFLERLRPYIGDAFGTG